ncbi:hypothetical protein [Nocardia sp. alder85J]|uniref:hypothetical protein n=1 Tax=Nocardia sp. alder85J TaxID=2862949 RepID=UPI001CD7E665|nr:hypothetical protein [Nocardia sp. alder85J]MCX4099280.1 hypothetical protein [Nocardia sp. alder85J]
MYEIIEVVDTSAAGRVGDTEAGSADTAADARNVLDADPGSGRREVGGACDISRRRRDTGRRAGEFGCSGGDQAVRTQRLAA